jgi:hypothetical protein
MSDKNPKQKDGKTRYTNAQIEVWKRDMESKGYVTSSPYFQAIEKWLQEP